MKSIKEKAEEYDRVVERISPNQSIVDTSGRKQFEAGANYVLDAIIECLPKTHSFNPNEVIDVIASVIKQLKK